MLSLRPITGRYGIQSTCRHLLSVSKRNASLTSSIERGVRKAANALKTAEKRRVREGTLGFWERDDKEKVEQSHQHARTRRKEETEQRQRLEFLRSGASLNERNGQSSHASSGPQETSDARAKKRAIAKGMLVDAPAAVPYTQPDSEFLFGTFAVLAALRSNRRRMHKLYMWCGEDGSLLDADGQTTEIVRQAKTNKVPLLRVAGSWEKMLDRMAERRPHNGLVLEASPLPQLPAKALHQVSSEGDVLTVGLNFMEASEKATHGLPGDAKTIDIPRVGAPKRYPFLLWLDRVTDTGNMGAIIRTAYFFGVDGIIVPQHGTAPLNAVVIKTSAGAAEHMSILRIGNEVDFIKRSKENGWKFFAAAARDSKSTVKRNQNEQSGDNVPTSEALKTNPCVLMLGNEGTGLRKFLQQEADESVAIASSRGAGKSVDSLNVSVAAALLTQRFMAP